MSGYWAGGLVGYNYSYRYGEAAIDSCYVHGNVTGTQYAGGLIGRNEAYIYTSSDAPKATVRYCYAIGIVGGATKGGLIGSNSGGTITSAYYNSSTSTCTDSNRGTPLTDENMKLAASYVGWDFTNDWGIAANINGGYPYLTALTASSKVAAVTANPSPGTVAAGTPVSLATATAGAEIRYTTNGTEPTASSVLYASPITVSATVTIKAKAFKSGMTDSDTLTAAYTVNIEPTPTITPAPTIAPTPTEPPPTGAPAITVGAATGKAGDTVEVTVALANNPGIAGFAFKLEFDNTKLTPVSIAQGPALATGSVTSNIQAGGDLPTLTFVSAAKFNASNFAADGILYTVKFKIKDGAELGDTALTLTYNSGEVSDQNFDDVDLAITNGSITVMKELVALDIELAAPVLGATPQSSVSGTGYTGAVAWSGGPEMFAADTVYTATVTLEAAQYHVFGDGAAASVNSGISGTTDSVTPEQLVFTVAFPETDGKTDVSDEIAFAGAEYMYNGSAQSLADAEIEADVTGGVFTYLGDSKSQTNVGEYSTTAVFDSLTAHGEKTVSWRIERAPLTVSGAKAADRVYNGATTVEITGASLVGVVPGDMVAIGLIGGVVETAGAGEGKPVAVSVTLGGADKDNYTVAAPEGIAVTVRPAQPIYSVAEKMNVTAGSALWVYTSIASGSGTGIDSEAVAGEPEWYSDSGYSAKVEESDVSGKPADTSVTLCWKFTPESANYAELTGQTTFTIVEGAAQAITFATPGPVAATYGDVPFANPATNASAGGTISYKSSDDGIAEVDAAGNVTIRSAGTATITATAAAVPGAWRETDAVYVLNIEQKALADDMLSIIGTYTYTGAAQSPEYAVAGGVTYAPSELSATDTGEYTFTITGIGNYKGTASAKFAIAPKTLTNDMLAITGAYTYTGAAQMPEYTVTDGITYTVAALDAVNAGEYTFTINGTGNYAGTATAAFAIAKADLAAGDITVALDPAVYDGAAKPVSASIPGKTGYGALAVKYNGAADAPVNAGEHAVTADVSDGTNYNAAQGLALGAYTIGKAALTLRAEDKSMTRGGALPELTFAVAGLKGGDTWDAVKEGDPELAAEADGTEDGEYAIAITGGELNSASGANYAIAGHEDGTLTVTAPSSPPPSGGSGGGGGTSPTPTPTQSPTPEPEPDTDITDPQTPGADTPDAPAPAIAFTDVRETDWFYGDMEFVYSRGLFQGTSATTFSPNTTMTRAMLVTVLYRLAAAGDGDLDVPGPGFADVPEGQWYTEAVAWAYGAGIVSGVGDGKFAPDAEITRQDLAVLLARYADAKGIAIPATRAAPAFADGGDVAGYAKDAAALLYSAGIVNGKPGNLFDPSGPATRAEVAAMLHRFILAAE